MKSQVHLKAAAGMAGAMLLVVGACGGDDKSAGSDSSASDSADDSTSTEQDDQAQTSSANLHPSLEGLPLPPGSEIPFPASEYDDERGTVVQLISVPLRHLEVAEFAFAEWPGAGYPIVERSGSATTLDDIDPEFGGVIYFENPDGVPVQVTLQVQGEKTALNFNVYTAEG